MKTSSSHAKTHAMDLQYTKCTKLCDEVYQLHVPKSGAISLDIVLFHGFQSANDRDAYLRCWRREEHPTCSLNSLLAEAFPQARILAVAYDASIIESEKKGRMDMYAIGENLMRSLISPAMVGQTCPVVLVGHCVGGLVLKEVCLRADDFVGREKHTDVHQCAYLHFLRNLRGAFFYATAHSGSPISGKGKPKRRGPLFAYLELLSSEAGRVNARFETLCGRHGWKVAGVSEANETDMRTLALTPLKRWFGRIDSTALVTQEAAGRQGMKDGYFCVIPGEDHFSICRPKDRNSTSFLRLKEFLRAICKEEEELVANQRRFLQLPVVMIDVPERIAAIVHMLQLESSKTSPLAVQLVGMGGIGKSTLAKQVLMNIQSHFDYVWFVEVGKQTLSSKILERFVADDLYTGRGRRMVVQHFDELWMLVKNSKVLMVLDDVESEEQIKLFLEPSYFGDGSRMIVTSRVQKAMPGFVTYVVPFLSDEDAEKLFRAHVDDVVLQKIPDELVREVVCKCDGLPLTLEVIGGHLRGETDISIWKGAVEKLCAADSLGGSVNDRLWQKLRLSFDGLGAAEQGRFLDLTSFDIDGPWQNQYDLAVFKAAWRPKSRGMAVEIEVQNLVDRSLIRLIRYYGAGGGRRDGKVHIHAQLRDMGRNICRPPGEKLKLCRGVWTQEDTEDLMMECKRETATAAWAPETLCMAMCPVGVSEAAVPSIPWSIFPRLECLRLLRMSNLKTTESNHNVRFPLTLTLLHMINCHRGHRENWWMWTSGKWPIRDEDVEGLYCLAVLLLDNCKFVQLPNNMDRLRSLRVVRIDASNMASLPDTFGLLPSLETLLLRSTNLQKLPSSFLQLRSLSSLKMVGCSGLKAWPTLDPYSIAPKESCLESLKVLHLEGLDSLAELPDSFGEMRNLEELEISDCGLLKTLPEGFSGLNRLNELRIYSCHGLRSLCESFGCLENLVVLDLRNLPALASLPSSTGSLTSLWRLMLDGIPRLSYIPESLGQLRALQHLSFSNCTSLKCLPESLEGLGALKAVNISNCTSFALLNESVYQLTALDYLDLYPTTTAISEKFPRSTGVLNHFQDLTTLCIHKCEIIDDSLGQLTRLRFLDIEDGEIERIPESLGLLTSLLELRVRNCKRLDRLPLSLGQLRALRQLSVRDCGIFEKMPESLRQMTRLSELDAPDLRGFKELHEGLSCLTQLRRLTIRYSGREMIKGVVDLLKTLPRLYSLRIYNSENFECLLESLGQLTNLGEIYIDESKALQGSFDLFSIGDFKNLVKLELRECEDLKTFRSNCRWGIRSLRIQDCRNFDRLAEGCETREDIYVSNCPKFTGFPDALMQSGKISYDERTQVHTWWSHEGLQERTRVHRSRLDAGLDEIQWSREDVRNMVDMMCPP